MNLLNLRLASKLWLSSFFIVLGILLVVGYAAYRSSSDRAESTQTLEKLNERIQLSLRWSGHTLENAARTKSQLLSTDESLVAAMQADIERTAIDVEKIQQAIMAAASTDTERSQINTIGELRKAVMAARAEVLKQKTEGTPETTSETFKARFEPAMASYQKAQFDFVSLQNRQYETTRAMFAQRTQNMVSVSSGLMIVLVMGILFGTATLVRSIRLPLNAANELAAKIAQGDLSMQIDTSRSDEFGELMRSLASMNDSLGQMVNQVRQSTDGIASASNEIAAGNNDLASRTEQTSSNLQSTASSMGHLTQTVQVSADNARQASQLAANASSVAERGGEVVRQVVSTMEDINFKRK